MEIMELKNTITEMKNSLRGFNRKWDMPEQAENLQKES